MGRRDQFNSILASPAGYLISLPAILRGKKGKKGDRQLFRKAEKVASPQDGYAFFNPASTRSGVNGASRRRTPTASKIALAMAAAIGALEGSPPPRAGI